MPVTLKRGDKWALVVGFGLLYGEHGSDAPYFTEDTDFMPRLVPEKPLLFEHNDAEVRGAIEGPIGTVISDEPNRYGRMVVAQLDLTAPGVTGLIPDIEAGKMAFSSACHSALYKASGKRIMRFPIVEYSLTRKPADWRLLGERYDTRLFPDGTSLSFTVKAGRFFWGDSGEPIAQNRVIELARQNHRVTVSCQDGSIAALPGFHTILVNILRHR